jgi:outer membrane protein OmpA-like peptidoglycan-associated protein
MARLRLGVQISTLAFTIAAGAFAQDAPPPTASGSASISTDDGATAVATAPAVEEQAAAAPATNEPFEPYEPGFPPEGHTLELGIFGGIFLPSPIHNLRNENYAHRKFGPGAEAGARLGYYPLSFFGIEAEAMGAGASVKNSNNQVVLYGFRAFGVLQAPTPYISPFLVVGGGRIGAVSRATGNDGDQGFLFGLGAKIPFNEAIGLRIDARDNLLPHVHEGRGQSHNLEVLLGLSATIGRTRKELPPPPADSDRDGFVDTADRCPNDVGVAPAGCPADTDSDGILDRDDYCPREAGPAPKGCPVIDTDPDKDNVQLPCDLCPNEKGVAPDGCPVRDGDGDGIFDDKDKCPKEPETRNGFEDADGCPDKLPDVVKKFSGVVQGIYFDQGKATIRPASTRTLTNAVKVMQDYPSVGIEIVGHTSSEGELSFNQQLSQDRADAVKAWLVEQGVDSTRISTRGAGPSEPIADNKTAAGREKNRRIEFKIKQ